MKKDTRTMNGVESLAETAYRTWSRRFLSQTPGAVLSLSLQRPAFSVLPDSASHLVYTSPTNPFWLKLESVSVACSPKNHSQGTLWELLFPGNATVVENPLRHQLLPKKTLS